MAANTCEKQAEAAKRKGNLYFKKEKLGAAIEAYTEAITLCPQVPVYWTNRALCERKRNEWEKVEADCRKALELDSKSVKGHYMLGLALLHYQQYGRAVAELEKALDLGRGAAHGTSYMVEEIWQELAKARFTQWEEEASARRQQRQDLSTFLHSLMKLDNQRKLKEIISVMLSFDNPPEVRRSPPPPDQSSQHPSADEEILHPQVEVNGAEDQASTTEDKVGGGGRGGGGLYPPIYGQDEDFDSTSESSVEENLGPQSDTSVDPKSGRGEEKPEHQKQTKAPAFGRLFHDRSRLRRRESLQIRLRKFMESGYFQSENVADSKQGFQQKNETKSISDDEKIPYSMYDVYKVFKEMVKLQQGEAGRELLRTTELYERRSKALNDLTKKLAAPDIPGEIPDHLCCTITMEIFRDPVMTPSGITYERSALEKHLNQVGGFDPVTRSPLTMEQVYPNLALRDAVQAYLVDHGWAYRA